MMMKNADAPARERRTLIRLFEELRAVGYEGGYDAVRRYAKIWSREHSSQSAATFSKGWLLRRAGAARDRPPYAPESARQTSLRVRVFVQKAN